MRERVIIAIDPSQRSSGVAFALIGPDPLIETYRLPEPIGVKAAAEAAAILDRHTEGREWFATVERAPPPRRGTRSAPLSATRAWLAALMDLAVRSREAVPAGERGRATHPTLLRPRPSDWRAPLGIACAPRERAKEQAIRYATRFLGLGLRDESEDEHEAACIAEWARRTLSTRPDTVWAPSRRGAKR